MPVSVRVWLTLRNAPKPFFKYPVSHLSINLVEHSSAPGILAYVLRDDHAEGSASDTVGITKASAFIVYLLVFTVERNPGFTFVLGFFAHFLRFRVS